jgi:hypothetical protein
VLLLQCSQLLHKLLLLLLNGIALVTSLHGSRSHLDSTNIYMMTV